MVTLIGEQPGGGQGGGQEAEFVQAIAAQHEGALRHITHETAQVVLEAAGAVREYVADHVNMVRDGVLTKYVLHGPDLPGSKTPLHDFVFKPAGFDNRHPYKDGKPTDHLG